jgi:hypothetical protein
MIAADAYGVCGLTPDELYSMTLKEFEQVRKARLDLERGYDMQRAQLFFIMASAWGDNPDLDIEDFMVFSPGKEKKEQTPEEQMQYIEGMNAIIGGK